jgi:hypothetical protein
VWRIYIHAPDFGRFFGGNMTIEKLTEIVKELAGLPALRV